MKEPSISVYEKAMKSKEIAATILLPLIEFEFSFNGAQKPALAQSTSNYTQLKKIFDICKEHNWISTQISELGSKEAYWFKISNRGFKEIYELSGPMADKEKDKWAKLLCECADKNTKDRTSKDKILNLIKNSDDVSVKSICLKTRLLPYTVTRHMRNLEENGFLIRTKDGFRAKR